MTHATAIADTDQAVLNPFARDLLFGAQRVLLVRLDEIGDHVVGSGLIRAMGETLPGWCGLVTSPAAAPILPSAAMDHVVSFDPRRQGVADVWSKGRQLAGLMRSLEPDVVVLPRFDFERLSVVVAFTYFRPPATITWSVRTSAMRMRRNWPLATLPGPRVPRRGAPLHELDRVRHFAQFVGFDPAAVTPTLAVDPDDHAPLPFDVPYVALGIGAGQAHRRWPTQRFSVVADELTGLGYGCVLLGTPDEGELARRICEDARRPKLLANLAGRCSLPESASIIAGAVGFVGNDSSLGHIAAATGKPTITISCHPLGAPPDHHNAPERWRPMGNPSIVLRPARAVGRRCTAGCRSTSAPCCITAVPVDEVLSACRSVFG
jgi:ADP-heptose:LPS heptosyltransferase